MIDARYAIDSVFEGKKGGVSGPGTGGGSSWRPVLGRFYISPRATVNARNPLMFPDRVIPIGHMPYGEEWFPRGFAYSTEVCTPVQQRINPSWVVTTTVIQAHVNWVAWYLNTLGDEDHSGSSSIPYAAGPELQQSDFVLIMFDSRMGWSTTEATCSKAKPKPKAGSEGGPSPKDMIDITI